MVDQVTDSRSVKGWRGLQRHSRLARYYAACVVYAIDFVWVLVGAGILCAGYLSVRENGFSSEHSPVPRGVRVSDGRLPDVNCCRFAFVLARE